MHKKALWNEDISLGQEIHVGRDFFNQNQPNKSTLGELHKIWHPCNESESESETQGSWKLGDLLIKSIFYTQNWKIIQMEWANREMDSFYHRLRVLKLKTISYCMRIVCHDDIKWNQRKRTVNKISHFGFSMKSEVFISCHNLIISHKAGLIWLKLAAVFEIIPI